jgi:hypothetical protein
MAECKCVKSCVQILSSQLPDFAKAFIPPVLNANQKNAYLLHRTVGLTIMQKISSVAVSTKPSVNCYRLLAQEELSILSSLFRHSLGPLSLLRKTGGIAGN